MTTTTQASGKRDRRIVLRTRGRREPPGSMTRLMAPWVDRDAQPLVVSEFADALKPFLFLDLFDIAGDPLTMRLHPHSGLATLTYVLEGSFTYEDTSGAAGVVPTEGVEWFRSGHGAWHGGGTGDAQRIRGFQLWVALPPEQELGSADSVYLQSESVPRDGPVKVLLGDYGRLSSPLRLPSSITYLDVQLKAGKRWSYQPPAGHTVCWIAVATGAVLTPEQVDAGELAAFEPCNDAVEFEARSDTEFVLGSAVKHPHELALGRYSVHTNSDALRKGEARIKQIKEHLVAEGRL
jgi:redox-sensitive bicupin YhaK (pirin superfamily)